MRIVETERFRRDFAALPATIKARARKQWAPWFDNPRHPSLQIEKLRGTQVWQDRITQKYRFTFQVRGDTCILRRIGPHDVERRP